MAATTFERLKLPAGVPVDFDLEACDVVRTDRGPAIRLRGLVDNAPMEFAASHGPMFTALAEAGVFGQIEPYNENDVTADRPLALRVVRRQLVLEHNEADAQRPLIVRVRGNTPSTPDPAAGASVRRFPHRHEMAHENAARFVFAQLLPIYREHGMEPTSTDLTSLINSQFIARQKG